MSELPQFLNPWWLAGLAALPVIAWLHHRRHRAAALDYIGGLTDRLVAEGLVERQDHPADRRAWTVRLTPEGARQFDAMARAHEAWVIGLFASLSPEQQQQLYALLGTLKAGLPDR